MIFQINKNDCDYKKLLKEYIYENYTYMCIMFSENLIKAISSVNQEIDIGNSKENIEYYSEQCINIIRKEQRKKSEFHFDKRMMDCVKENNKQADEQ